MYANNIYFEVIFCISKVWRLWNQVHGLFLQNGRNWIWDTVDSCIFFRQHGEQYGQHELELLRWESWKSRSSLYIFFFVVSCSLLFSGVRRCLVFVVIFAKEVIWKDTFKDHHHYLCAVYLQDVEDHGSLQIPVPSNFNSLSSLASVQHSLSPSLQVSSSSVREMDIWQERYNIVFSVLYSARSFSNSLYMSAECED